MAIKIGCILYVRFPAMLRPSYPQSKKNLGEESDGDEPVESVLVLFMN
jgi:hypothetical protein